MNSNHNMTFDVPNEINGDISVNNYDKSCETDSLIAESTNSIIGQETPGCSIGNMSVDTNFVDIEKGCSSVH